MVSNCHSACCFVQQPKELGWAPGGDRGFDIHIHSIVLRAGHAHSSLNFRNSEEQLLLKISAVKVRFIVFAPFLHLRG